ncbi:MAG: NADH-quinone oxidoreductase subunit C [Alphaproteobacteria bacterium]|nr:NADH-quinone oxidoreductase subunit C [Alphaproteobacteria bacterium]
MNTLTDFLTNEILCEKIEDIKGNFIIYCSPEQWIEMMSSFKSNKFFVFDYMYCLTCVDLKDSLEMNYFLRATSTLDEIQIKVKLDKSNPKIETASLHWDTADILEREVYDLFGVFFSNHPNLKRIILPEDFEGFPLRKDFVDPINLIKL